MEFKIFVGWDEENQKFFIIESDVEGLWLEKPTFEALVDARFRPARLGGRLVRQQVRQSIRFDVR